PALGFDEGLVKAGGEPAVAFVQLAAERDQMHDREDPGLRVELAFERAIVREQARDVGVTAEDLRLARADQRIDLALGEQRRQRQAAVILFNAERLQQRGRVRPTVAAGVLDRTLNPTDPRKIDAELMGEMAAHPDRRGLGIERHADTFAFQVLRRANACVGVDEDIAVPEHARGKHRQRYETSIAVAGETDEFGRRKLGDVELGAADHAVEHVATRPERDADKIDAFDGDRSLADRLHPIVTAAGEAQPEAGHGTCLRALPPPQAQRFENWKLRRALARPYFLRSTTRGSRVRKPPRLSAPRRSGS